MTDIVRVLRILEYVGPRSDVERNLVVNAVPANGQQKFGSVLIRSAVIGQYPEIMEQSDGQ